MLHVVNHPYHVERIKDPNARIVVIGSQISDPRIVLQVPLYETLSLFARMSFRFTRFYRQVSSYAMGDKNVVVWGCQDRLSSGLCSYLKGEFEFHIVPDNMEHFVRTTRKHSSALFGFAKAITYRQGCDFLLGRVGFWCRRFVYPLPKRAKLSNEFAFFDSKKNDALLRGSDGDFATFISQPYDQDMGIDTDEWAKRVISILDQHVGRFGKIKVQFHPRDSLAYREALNLAGYDDADNCYGVVLGFFSTLLFQQAINGREVYVFFSLVADLFPLEYVDFAEWIGKQIEFPLDGSHAISISPNDFNLALYYH